MATIRARSFVGEADFPAIAELWNACEAVDRTGAGASVNELRVEFADPWLDVQRNVRLWEDADGSLIGFAQLWTPQAADTVQGRIVYVIHPDHRHEDFELQVVGWAEGRLRDVGRERGLVPRLHAVIIDHQTWRIALLERRGFAPERYTLVMARSLDEPLPEPQPPAGFTIRPVAGVEEAEAWVELFNLSFIDHWNHHPLTVERWLNWWNDPVGQPELNLIAVAPDGTFAAFCWAGFDPEENQRSGQNIGWVHLLGTRRGFRQIGLGRAILLTGMQCLQARGMAAVKLSVDAQSLTGATRLYEAAGFQRAQTWVRLAKDLELERSAMNDKPI